VRGKEVKSVEFCTKANNILVDGISLIEELSFNAFNEETRLVHCLTQKLAVNAELLRENCILAMKNRYRICPKRPETDINMKF